ncbi:MAG: hypothetical protein IJZ42_12120 [Lachnospiraceae bacterium]|nr:hypothetical protein [Lachnospiraceae bacterium]
MVGADGSTWVMLRMYSGNGSLILLFVASVIYLWIAEKNKGRKAILVYSSVALLVLFFLPFLSNYVINTIGEEEIYYRLLWALPMGVVIAYAAVKFISALKKKWLQAGLLFLLVAYIVVGGHLVYKSPQLSKAENPYQVPDAVVNICDAIEVPGREVMAIFPHELIQYVRQYSPRVVMPYGYDALVERWQLGDELEQEMSKDVSDVARLSELARQRGCHFIVLNQNHLLSGELADYEYTLILQTDGYDVYIDNYADLSLPE